MKPSLTRVLAVLLVVSSFGAGMFVLAQQDAVSPEQLEMMKKMMMNRPAAMKEAGQTIQDQKTQAIAEGNYSCCLRHSCDYCALNMGQCPCRPNLQRGMAVCNECKGGWHAGDGAIAGIDADDVKTMPRMDMEAAN